jgi:hypothetical protein
MTQLSHVVTRDSLKRSCRRRLGMTDVRAREHPFQASAPDTLSSVYTYVTYVDVIS